MVFSESLPSDRLMSRENAMRDNFRDMQLISICSRIFGLGKLIQPFGGAAAGGKGYIIRREMVTG